MTSRNHPVGRDLIGFVGRDELQLLPEVQFARQLVGFDGCIFEVVVFFGSVVLNVVEYIRHALAVVRFVDRDIESAVDGWWVGGGEEGLGEEEHDCEVHCWRL